MTGSRSLVVGGAGFVGANLVRLLLTEGAEQVLVVDNFLSSERANLPDDPRLDLIEASIADTEVLASLDDDFDVVYHLATYHGNQSSIANPLEDHENNLITTLRLYERLKSFRRLRKVVYSASGCTLAPHEVYEDAAPVSEEGSVPFDLDSPYQISKVVGEFYSVYYQRQHGLPAVRARFQNVYGPGEVLGAGRWRGTPATVWRNVTPTFVYRALEGLPLQLDNGGVASRDFVYVEDVARGLLACAEHAEPGEVYNLASGVETTIRRLAELVIELSGSTSELEVAPRRPWDHSILRFGSPEKARSELGFQARMPLEEGLRQTIEWTSENLEFIESCMAKHARQLQPASAG
jgi:nucleoside-diphosphate-sugar epimerase